MYCNPSLFIVLLTSTSKGCSTITSANSTSYLTSESLIKAATTLNCCPTIIQWSWSIPEIWFWWAESNSIYCSSLISTILNWKSGSRLLDSYVLSVLITSESMSTLVWKTAKWISLNLLPQNTSWRSTKYWTSASRISTAWLLSNCNKSSCGLMRTARSSCGNTDRRTLSLNHCGCSATACTNPSSTLCSPWVRRSSWFCSASSTRRWRSWRWTGTPSWKKWSKTGSSTPKWSNVWIVTISSPRAICAGSFTCGVCRTSHALPGFWFRRSCP